MCQGLLSKHAFPTLSLSLFCFFCGGALVLSSPSSFGVSAVRWRQWQCVACCPVRTPVNSSSRVRITVEQGANRKGPGVLLQLKVADLHLDGLCQALRGRDRPPQTEVTRKAQKRRRKKNASFTSIIFASHLLIFMLANRSARGPALGCWC